MAGRCRFLCLIFLALTVWSPGSSWARKAGPYITDVALKRGAEQDLVVAFGVENAMDQRVLDTLDSGLPVRFRFRLRVLRPVELGRDEVLADVELQRVLEKDNLKDRYLITWEDGQQSSDVPDLAAALQRMSRVDGVSLVPLAVLPASPALQLQIRARLQEFQLPFRLHYILTFVSYWDVETDWYRLDLPIDPASIP